MVVCQEHVLFKCPAEFGGHIRKRFDDLVGDPGFAEHLCGHGNILMVVRHPALPNSNARNPCAYRTACREDDATVKPGGHTDDNIESRIDSAHHTLEYAGGLLDPLIETHFLQGPIRPIAVAVTRAQVEIVIGQQVHHLPERRRRTGPTIFAVTPELQRVDKFLRSGIDAKFEEPAQKARLRRSPKAVRAFAGGVKHLARGHDDIDNRLRLSRRHRR